jgi:hypothetical protein
VVNVEFPTPTILNAVAHALLGLAGANEMAEWNLLRYPSPAFQSNNLISEYPVIILRSKRSAALEKLTAELSTSGIAHNVFIDSMIGASASEQQSATFAAEPGRNRLVCVCLFGDEERIRPFIKSFSIYKMSDSVDPLVRSASESVKIES